jgi:ion channel-forming bestrophin family protein
MISYNPKDWFKFIFRFHKSDTVRRLFPLILVISAYSGGIAYLEINYWKLTDAHPLKNISLMHGLLGFVISMLLVFRTNTAYDRWWEGRKLWGTLVNSSRNLALKLAAILDEDDEQCRSFFRAVIPQFASTLKLHLTSESTRLALDEKPHPELDLDSSKHMPNQLAAAMYNKVNKLYKSNKISGEQLMVLNNELQAFTDITGACERIKNTPIPYSYSAFIKKFIFIYVLTLPFGYSLALDYYVIPVVAFVFYVLASLEQIAEEIEDPFGSDQNDLPMQRICENIQKHVAELL